ncbi:ABC transporter B family member 15 [Forsythia ovata]|uniref:ABC transporter B family member 15 n=1 Tax=Forsythia ovata TaxID=205694 RepID=A0ABD1SL69_9LAMI
MKVASLQQKLFPICLLSLSSSQTRILHMLEKAQDGPQKESIRQSWFVGIGTSQSLMTCTWALDFWYGGKLLAEGSIGSRELFQTLMILVSTGRVIANAGTMTKDLAKDAEAVGSIFAVLDRCSLIELEDPHSYKPDKLTGHVELQDVYFAYPARPKVMIFKGFSIIIEAGSTNLKKSKAIIRSRVPLNNQNSDSQVQNGNREGISATTKRYAKIDT